jgi:hypothetical protein
LSEAEARAAAWLAAWDAQGIHRTGTDADNEGAAWLAREAAQIGLAARLEQFALDRLDPVIARLEIDGAEIPAVPVFDAPSTGPDGVAGRLGSDIAVAELAPQAVYSGEFERVRRGSAARGLVVLCRGAAPGLALLNAEGFRAPYGLPAVHIGSEARDTVLAAAARGAPARLVAFSRRRAARACNTVVAIRGRRPDVRPLVVMTPRSSWWQSTAERGGGLVCWLETLRALAAAPPARDVILTANSGHELGHFGIDDFLLRRPGWERPQAEGGALWLHYGANIGARGGALTVMSNREEWRALAAEALPPHAAAPATQVPSGETRDIHRAGGAYLTLVGSNPFFHLPQDRWPHVVDVAAIARIAAAAARLAATLAG